MDAELDDFKTHINLVAYAASIGYEIDQRESSKRSVVLRRNTDKIVVATSDQQHGIYFSVRDDSDNGTIIDFIQKRQHLNLGQIRQQLRQWKSSSHISYSLHNFKKPLVTNISEQNIFLRLSKMSNVGSDHRYLVHHRGIKSSVLADERFVDKIKVDARQNAIFPHFDRQGACGYEIKNIGFTGFATGGCKGFWFSSNLKSAACIVIVESGIDALSHAQLFTGDFAYISLAGTLSEKQRDLIAGLLTKSAARQAKIVVATDSDEAGEKYYTDITALENLAIIERQRPSCKDWNDQLKQDILL